MTRMLKPSPTSGFTLVELMVVVVIIAILATIALPSYNSYVKKSHIKAAQSDLVALGLVLEGHYQRTLGYPDYDLEESATKQEITEAFSAWKPTANNFDYELESDKDESTYTLTATGSGDLDGCSLTLDQTNERTTTGCGIASW